MSQRKGGGFRPPSRPPASRPRASQPSRPPSRPSNLARSQAQHREQRARATGQAPRSPSPPPQHREGGRPPMGRPPPPMGGHYHRPPTFVPYPVFGWGWGWRSRPTTVIINDYGMEERVYEREGSRYGVSWGCDARSERGNDILRKIGSAFFGIVVFMFIIYPLFSLFYWGMIYPEDIYIMLVISAVLIPLAIIFTVRSSIISRRCYTTRELL